MVFNTSGWMTTFCTSCLPFRVTETAPSPAVPVKDWPSNDFWNSAIFSFRAWAWRIMSNMLGIFNSCRQLSVVGRQPKSLLTTADRQLLLGVIPFDLDYFPTEHLEGRGDNGFFLF